VLFNLVSAVVKPTTLHPVASVGAKTQIYLFLLACHNSDDYNKLVQLMKHLLFTYNVTQQGHDKV